MKIAILLVAALGSVPIFAKPRARELGIPLDGTPAKLNAITDVAGVEVGQVTLKEGTSVRTGVTAIWPKGKTTSRVPAATFALNGNGEMTGTIWIEESGFLDGPIVFTNTYSVGVAHDAVRQWAQKNLKKESADADDPAALPVVGETWDGLLNDINGFHVRREHVVKALETASRGAVEEGAVGGGTGMVCFEFKCGIGTSSRKVRIGFKDYTLGVIVQANFGRRAELKLGGVPAGKKLTDLMPEEAKAKLAGDKDGSILIVIATDAPLLPHQLKRVARRASLGLARTGSIAHHSSGDLFLAFSTATPDGPRSGVETWKAVANEEMDALFVATVEATEESILNSLAAGETMIGARGAKVHAFPVSRIKDLL